MKKFNEYKKVILESGVSDHLKDVIDVDKLIEMLKNAWSEEILAWYQYTISRPFLVGNERTSIEKLYEENGDDELKDHGYWLIERINQLGGDFKDIDTLENLNKIATHKYIKPMENVEESIKVNIEMEKGAIETYKELELFTRDKDVVTNRKIKDILGDEEEHLQKLEELLDDIKNTK